MSASAQPATVVDTSTLRAAVEKADVVFRESRRLLQGGKPAFDLAALLALQSRLARVLYAIEQQILGFKQHKKDLLVQKRKGRPTENLGGEIQRLEQHIRAAESAIDRGKMIGDSFAWLFIAQDQPLLRRHFQHERQDHLPVGIGGIGEIEFITKAPLWGSHLAIYHGLTTFLRIGDVSFVDVQTGRIEGMAELKTRRVAPNQYTVSVTYMGKKLPIKVPPAGLPPRPPEPAPAEQQKFRDILRRQEAKIRQALAPPVKDVKPVERFGSAHIEFAPQVLEGLFDEAKVGAASSVQFSPSLVLAGIKLPVSSLAERVLNETPVDAEAVVAHVVPQVVKAALPGSPDNALAFGWLVFPSHGRYQLPFGIPPLLWWPVRPEVIEALASGTFAVLTFFNPAPMIAALTKNGFTVRKKHAVRGFELRRAASNGYELVFQQADYFFNLVSQHLVTEASVVELHTRLADEMATRKPGGRINLEMVFRGRD